MKVNRLISIDREISDWFSQNKQINVSNLCNSFLKELMVTNNPEQITKNKGEIEQEIVKNQEKLRIYEDNERKAEIKTRLCLKYPVELVKWLERLKDWNIMYFIDYKNAYNLQGVKVEEAKNIWEELHVLE